MEHQVIKEEFDEFDDFNDNMEVRENRSLSNFNKRKNAIYLVSYCVLFIIVGVYSLIYMNAPNYNPNKYIPYQNPENSNLTSKANSNYKILSRYTKKSSKFLAII